MSNGLGRQAETSRSLPLYTEQLYRLYQTRPRFHNYEQYLKGAYLLRHTDIITGSYHAPKEQARLLQIVTLHEEET